MVPLETSFIVSVCSRSIEFSLSHLFFFWRRRGCPPLDAYCCVGKAAHSHHWEPEPPVTADCFRAQQLSQGGKNTFAVIIYIGATSSALRYSFPLVT